MREKMQVIAILVAAMVAGYVGGLMSQANGVNAARSVAPSRTPITGEIVRAKKFVLVDSAGKTRGIFSTDKGEPRLVLFDATGKTRGMFGTDKGEPSIMLADSAGKPRGIFSMYKGEPSLMLADSAGKPRGQFSMIRGAFYVRYSPGKERRLLRSMKGEPFIGLQDPSGDFLWTTPLGRLDPTAPPQPHD